MSKLLDLGRVSVAEFLGERELQVQIATGGATAE